jgi:hypothetical protein
LHVDALKKCGILHPSVLKKLKSDPGFAKINPFGNAATLAKRSHA